MVKGTKAEQALAREEASSSRPKRQRVPSIVEEEGENGGGDVVVRSGTLFELDLLDCPICCNALTIPIFQCDKGHIACSSCCTNVSNKCPYCSLAIGNYRSRIMERVVEAFIVRCPIVAGEASSRRLRVPSIDEENGENGGRDVVVPSGTLSQLDLLDCSVCSKALKISIFQCDNGHVACSSCCIELRYKCPSCSLPIGNYRCIIMEKVVKAIIVPCQNAKHGCTETFSYGNELVHEKKCSFALCYCPADNCNYAGVFKDLYSHYAANHGSLSTSFRWGHSIHACMIFESKSYVLQKHTDGPLVVLQCFKEPQGLFLTVNCIAPSAPVVGKFSYELSYSTAGNTLTFRSSEMNRIQKVSFQTPEKDFMFIPEYIFNPTGLFKGTCICIRSLEEEEEEEEEEEDNED
ncbi:Seven-in-absentia protein TRAF-like domain [Arabidopsis thaliana x Arabidopsis arenosa]|uniref:RING-type E3 ubiquitin transferase n=2 Tax=Arabidopsis TaxID=3701 RepID=A0A178W6Y7_ARATH|nr:Seven-in-absentia protein TRAF-like domain [Arabidopsis thaliana x Arabidopsis arenosa]OAP13255.1 hypothetical protein AXX17_AT1G60360 [Arabidopsis thaliana]